MTNANRREFKRLKINRRVKIPLQIYPIVPFIGEAIQAGLINLSAGGMALSIEHDAKSFPLKKKSKLVIHFRLPGRPLQECAGVVTHVISRAEKGHVIGIRFSKLPVGIFHEIKQMTMDNDLCDRRIKEEPNPWCVPTCSFHNLCRKPIRHYDGDHAPMEQLEIALAEAR